MRRIVIALSGVIALLVFIAIVSFFNDKIPKVNIASANVQPTPVPVATVKKALKNAGVSTASTPSFTDSTNTDPSSLGDIPVSTDNTSTTSDTSTTTDTATPTSTPQPTDTPAPNPTDTPVPADTPTPIDTTIPSPTNPPTLPQATPTLTISATPSITDTSTPTPTPTQGAVFNQSCSAVNNAVSAIEAQVQPLISSTEGAECSALSARNISCSSSVGQQQIIQAVQPVYTQEDLQIEQVCLNSGCPCVLPHP